MKSIRVYAVFAVAVTAVFALSSFTSSSSKESQTEIEQRCTYILKENIVLVQSVVTVRDSLLSRMVTSGRNHIANTVAIKGAVIDN